METLGATLQDPLVLAFRNHPQGGELRLFQLWLPHLWHVVSHPYGGAVMVIILEGSKKFPEFLTYQAFFSSNYE